MRVIDFVDTLVTQVSKAIYRVGNGPRHLDAVREAMHEAVGVAACRQKFAGDDTDNREFFDGFSLQGLITAAYAQLWGRSRAARRSGRARAGVASVVGTRGALRRPGGGGGKFAHAGRR